jgi:hypothetical protein
MREALERHVPANASVASQNDVNSSLLAHRASYVQFPGDASVVVVDAKRPRYVFAGIDPAAFDEHVQRLRRERPVLYESDGFVIFGPPIPRPAS